MDDYREFEGKSTEDALAKAQAFYDLPLGRLEVEVVSAGSSGLFGLMGKKARIRVKVMADSTRDDLAALAAVVSDSPRRGPQAIRPPAPAPPTTPPPPAPRPVAPPPAPRVEAQPPVAVAPRPVPAPAAPATPPTPVPPPAVAALAPEPAEDEDLLLEDLREETLEPVEDVAGLEEEDDYEEGSQPRRVEEADVVEHARQVLARLVACLDPLATVSASANEHGILLEVDSREAGTLIGRRGQNLEALQYLATRIVAHKAGRPVRLNVDAGGYRGRRREALEDLARKAAAKARSGGKPVAVGPLSSPERRVVHMTLKNEPGVFTASRGRGEMKKVIVSAR